MPAGEERGEDADGGQEGADAVDEGKAGVVRQDAQQGRAEAAHAEGEAEEEPGDEADPAGHQLLGVDQDRREGRGEHQSDDDAEGRGPAQADVGQEQGEGQDPQDGGPDDPLAADAVADGPAQDGARGHGPQEQEEPHLGAADREAEAVHEEEHVEVRQAGHVEVFGEDQRPQDAHGGDEAAPGQPGMERCGMGGGLRGCEVPPVPGTHVGEQGHGEQGGQGEPGDAALAPGHDDEGREQGPHRRACVAAHLEHGLREAMPAAGGHAGHPG